jgi:hypothetical protein|tara:strand:- start:256 stop:2274 length:2019 start_codon:yes stop_codon:yes gene_type:complete
MDKLSDDEIVSILSGEVEDSSSFIDSEISTQRERSMEYFYGEPFGNEEDGRSQVVVTDVQDTIMWMMPSLMRIFTSGKDVVRFTPEGPEDVQIAEQATNYVNHVFYKQNNGFDILYNFFFDALLQKVGIVKHYWEDITKTTTESYEKLTEQEFSLISEDEELEILEHTEDVTVIEVPDPQTGELVQVEDIKHDVTFSRTKMSGKVTIDNIPPEEFLINRGAKSLEDFRFVCHRSHKTRTELIEMGFDEELVEGLASSGSSVDGLTTSQEYMARHAYDSTNQIDTRSVVRSEDTVEVFESYTKLDLEDTGVGVLYKVIHSGNEMLEMEPVDTIPFSSICPIPIPHKFYGLSVAETVEDIQLVRSTLTRNLLDNMYLANNGRFQVVEGQVNIDDLLTNRPGGIVRTRSPNALQPIQTPALQQYSFEMLDYWDKLKAGRTGVNGATQGLPADVLKSHVTQGAVQGALSNAQGRVELIARVFADTGVKSMFKNIYNLVQRYEDSKKVMRLNNAYYEVDPSSWKEDLDVSVEVGLGYGDQDVRLNNLSSFSALIEKVATQTDNMVSPQNIYNLVKELGAEMGIKNADQFISQPEPVEPPPPSPQDILAQAQAQALTMEAETSRMEAQVKASELEIKAGKLELERLELENNINIKKEELKLKGVELGFEMSSGQNVKA